MTSTHARRARARTFTAATRSADPAARFLTDQGLPPERVEVVWDAIALHLHYEIAIRKRPEIALVTAGAGFDLGPEGPRTLPAGYADRIHAAMPRLHAAPVLYDTIVGQALDKPHKAPPFSMPGELVRQETQAIRPTWKRLMTQSPAGTTATATGRRREHGYPDSLRRATARSRTPRTSRRRNVRSYHQRRERILTAALDLITEDGVAGVSHRKIAARAGVPLGSMTYHFSGIDDVLREAFTQFADHIVAVFEAHLSGAADRGQARKAVADLVHALAGGPQRDLVLTQELYTLAARRPDYRSLTTRWMRRSRALLEQHFDPATARQLDALIEGLALHHALDSAPHDRALTEEAIARITATP